MVCVIDIIGIFAIRISRATDLEAVLTPELTCNNRSIDTKSKVLAREYRAG